MKLLIPVFLLLLSLHTVAQPAGMKTVKKTQYHRINKACGYERYWYEVQLPNKTVAAKINTSIRSIFSNDIFKGHTERPCDTDYHFYYNCEVGTFNKSIFSFAVTFRYCDQEFNCYHERYDSHETRTYDIATGKLLTINDIIISGKKAAFDSMIVHRYATDSKQEDSIMYRAGIASTLVSDRFCFRKDLLFLTFDNGLFFHDMIFTPDELVGYVKPEYLELKEH